MPHRFAIVLSLAVVAGSAATPAAASRPSARAQSSAGYCSRATANRVLEAHGYVREQHLPVTAGVICGHFVGANSKAMVATIAHGACWGIVGWAVIAYQAGRWRLISRGDGALFLDPFVAVGDGFRESQRLFRKTDTGCDPTRGTRTRTWHWNASRKRLMASAWKYTILEPNPQEFRVQLARGSIACGAYVDDQVACFAGPTVPEGGVRVRQVATLRPDGQVVRCTDGPRAEPCLQGDLGSPLPTLTTGQRTVIGPSTCTVLEAGVQCTLTATGKGFLITPTDISLIAP